MKNEWVTTKISNIYAGLFDGPHATPPDSNKGAVYLGISNITKDGHIDLTNIKHISEHDLPKWTKRVTPQEGDIVFSYEATLNLYGLIPNGFWGCLGRRMALIRPDESKCHGKFLYYYFFSPQWRNTIAENTILGATVDRIPIAKFPDFPVSIPSLQTQKRIADILSAYDNLIENNQRQIRLLEEAAQRLYKEWFVDLRFPGYENTPIVDGIPEGWERCLLGDINCSLESGSRPKGGIDASLVDGVPSIGAENVIGLGRYNFSSEKLITKDFFSKMKRGKLRDKDILIYKDGAYIGRTSLFQDGFPHIEAAVNEHVFLLHAVDERFQYYLFFTLYQKEYYQKMQKLNKNAAQPGINSKAMMSLPVLLPTEDIISMFNIFIEPLVRKIFCLAKQNRQLELARDRLLPKLMSGEIEV